VGHLYQGRYKAFLIDADSYLLEVSRYIHLNPIRMKAFLKRPVKERWDILLRHKASSLPGYFSVRERRDFVNYRTVLDYMGGDKRKGRQSYHQFIRWGVEQELENPLDIGKGNGIVGEDDFIQWIKDKYLSNEASKREQPALRELRRELKPEELIEHFANLVGKGKEDICRRGKKSLERAMLMELLYRLCQIAQPEIGRLIGGIDYSAVSQARKRLQIRLNQEPGLKKKFDKLINQMIHLSRGKI